MQQDANIFVAGHTGLIGSAVARRLARDSHVRVITRSRAQLDLTNGPLVKAFFDQERPSHVVLAAGRVGGIVDNLSAPAELMEDNVVIQANVLRAARSTDVTRLILFGSSCMYPRDCSQPMPERELLTGRPEASSLPYAVAKLAGTYMCLAHNTQIGANRFLPLIPNSAYGPHDNFDPQSGHVLSALMARFHEALESGRRTVTLWGSGTPRREFVHADDIADACLHLLEHDVDALEFPMNIGVGSDISIGDLARTVAQVVGYNGQIDWDLTKPDGAPCKLLDSSRLRSTGWRPKVPLADGLASTYAWYRSNVCTSELK